MKVMTTKKKNHKPVFRIFIRNLIYWNYGTSVAYHPVVNHPLFYAWHHAIIKDGLYFVFFKRV